MNRFDASLFAGGAATVLTLSVPLCVTKMTRSQRTALWLAINGCGALLYLYFASWVWPPFELRGRPEGHAAGDFMIWTFFALPAFLVPTALDLVVLAWGTSRRLRHGAWPFTRWAWLIPLLWLITFSIDRYLE